MLAVCFYGIGALLSKNYANTGSLKFWILAMIDYTFVSVCWLWALRINNNLAIMTVIWDVLYIFIAVIMGVVFFKESLNLYNYVGIALIIVALFLLNK
jgi:drug/metabolite transporter (DMT)-like permease